MITKGRLWPPFFVRPSVTPRRLVFCPAASHFALRMKILGILNITSDSFSDGGRYLEPGAALFHAQAMAQVGAAIIDIGAASSNPDSAPVAAEVEIARLGAVVPELKSKGLPPSIDSFSTEVQRWALTQGVDYL